LCTQGFLTWTLCTSGWRILCENDFTRSLYDCL